MNYVMFPLLALMMIASANLVVQLSRLKSCEGGAAGRWNPNLMAQLFRQMTVCGVGLIGGSLALIARRAGLVGKVVGLGRSQANLDVALERGMIDVATRDPVEAARGADLIVLAVPIQTMRATLEKMIEHTAPDAVVTDVGSVKEYVVRELEPVITGKRALVAAHPVAGKETTGAVAADPALFRDRRVILTPSAKSTPEAINKIEQLWDETGACVEMMDADDARRYPRAIESSAAGGVECAGGGARRRARRRQACGRVWSGRTARYDAAGGVVVGDVARYFRDQSRGYRGGAETLRPNLRGISAGGRSRRHGRRRKDFQSRARDAGKDQMSRTEPIIAIDGPVGAGKSVAARELARALGFSYLNTGAMYRAVAIAAREAGVSPDDANVEARLAPVLAAIKIKFDGENIMLNGRDVTAK